MTRTITYRFETDGATPWSYALTFDASHHLVAKPTKEIREWTRLEYHQCTHCPLKKETQPQCPVARNLDEVVENFKSVLSFTKYKVTVEAPERTYSKECSTQEGLKSLFGLIMACSGCPHLDWLKPLARFHLPFGDLEETLFRTLSLQLLDDFLGHSLSDPATISKRIADRYQGVETVNHAFAERIRYYCEKDADKNAISSLDVFVQMFQFQKESNFSALRRYFTQP